MTTIGTVSPIRILICSPVDGVLGGIPAAVGSLLQGLAASRRVAVTRMPYAVYGRYSSKVLRLLRELAQLPVFVFVLIRRGPHVVQIETSVDKKTLIRDSLFIGIARLFRRHIVLRSHGGVFDLIPTWNPGWRWFARTVLGGCDHVVLLARQTKLEFDEFMRGRVASTVIPNAIDPALSARNMDRKRERPEGLRLVTAGRLISTKGVEDAVMAMSRLKTPGVTLTIFGDGPSTPEIKRLIGELGLEDRVILRGVVPESELPPYYLTSADAFVFPSSHREGFPMAFFTALACGLGAIATRVRPLPDYLHEPTHCLWVEPHDPEGLARQIERLATEPNLLSVQRHANPLLTRQFSPDQVAASFLDLYETLVGGRPRSGAPEVPDREEAAMEPSLSVW